MICCSPRVPWLFATLAVLWFWVPPGGSQEKSVRPGINKPFENPNVKTFIGTFETESREIYAERKRIVEACSIRPGMAVADIGAGTGLFTRLFAKEVMPDGTVYAVDIAPKFIQHIETTCKEAGIKNVVGVVCTADSVKLPASSIDLAFICDTYHHFEFPHKTMTSLHQALRPRGKVVLVDFERIEGKSRPWVLNHVRAGQEVVTKEITSNGFKQIDEKRFLKENYVVIFEKLDEPKESKTMLIEPEQLHQMLTHTDVRVLDTRTSAEYAAGHVSGATHVDVKTWQQLSSREGGLHDTQAWAEKVGQLGIRAASEVVVYGSKLPDTARVWWTLKYLGLQRVSLLDGGWSLWIKEHRPTELSTTAIIVPAKFEPKFQPDRLEEIDTLKKTLHSSDLALLDTRSIDEYTGKEVRGKRGGHIPGAKLLEWKELVADDGRFKSGQELRDLFRERGIRPDQTAVTC
jgi:3-mercaptopyruvate sulfurtransferase SseA/precorrin-6B methylase 2